MVVKIQNYKVIRKKQMINRKKIRMFWDFNTWKFHNVLAVRRLWYLVDNSIHDL